MISGTNVELHELGMAMLNLDGFYSDQVCNKCVFLRTCNYKVKVLKSIDSPYCFEDSMYHQFFVLVYGKEI